MIYLFNVGAYKGEVADEFMKMFKEVGKPYTVYMYEPASAAFKQLQEKYKDDSNVVLVNKACSDKTGQYKLYLTPRPDGNTLHVTKWNVTRDISEVVECVKLSDEVNRIVGPDDFVIVSMNAEGSEYEVYTDMIESGTHKKVNVFAGSLGDLYKLKDKTKEDADKFVEYMKDNGIDFMLVMMKDLSNMAKIKDMVSSIVEPAPVLKKKYKRARRKVV